MGDKNDCDLPQWYIFLGFALSAAVVSALPPPPLFCSVWNGRHTQRRVEALTVPTTGALLSM